MQTINADMQSRQWMQICKADNEWRFAMHTINVFTMCNACINANMQSRLWIQTCNADNAWRHRKEASSEKTISVCLVFHSCIPCEQGAQKRIIQNARQVLCCMKLKPEKIPLLKGTVSWDFWVMFFFHQIASPGPIRGTLRWFQFWSNIREDIRIWNCLHGVRYTAESIKRSTLWTILSSYLSFYMIKVCFSGQFMEELLL